MQVRLYSATGNRLWVLEDSALTTQNFQDYAPRAQALCRNQRADGVMLLNTFTHELWILNADGSDGGFCGNGVRAAAYHLATTQDLKSVELKMGGHLIQAKINNKLVFLQFADPQAAVEQKIVQGQKAYFLKVPNPHLVFLVPPNTWKIEVEGETFCDEANTNVEFVYPEGNEFHVSVYERGVGVTAACGSGAIAVFKTLQQLKLIADAVRIKMPGGLLTVEAQGNYLIMAGEVNFLEAENIE